jgi:type I restriction enzyme S subunit
MPSAEIERYKVSPGDLLFIRVNGSSKLVGRCILCGVEREDLAFNDHLIRVRVNEDLVLPQYIAIWAETSDARDQILGRAVTTAGQYTVNHSAIFSTELPLPSLGEQREIVRRVGRLFGLAAAIEGRVRVATGQAERLVQAVLTQAFRGELVPTEAELARREGREYEPASELLARVKAERATSR